MPVQIEERKVFSSTLKGSQAVINGSAIGGLPITTADVMCGLDTWGWPEIPTKWWSPPLPSFQAGLNAILIPYNPARDVLRAKQSRFFQNYQEQVAPLQSYSAGVNGFTVYDFASDMVRDKQSSFVQEYQEHKVPLASFQVGLNGFASLAPPPTYTSWGPRFTVHQPVRPFLISIVNMQTFNTKDPTESVPLTFDMSPDLNAGETLSGFPAVSVSVISGTDTNPSAILNGTAGFDLTVTQVIQPVTGGVSGTVYQISVICSTTNPQKILRLAGNMPVRSLS